MISIEALKNRAIPEVLESFTVRDTILYALGLGLGLDPLDRQQLDYVYEDGLKALPTMASVFGHERTWIKASDIGLDYLRSVHGEQHLTMHRSMPTQGLLRGRTRIADVIDKGAGSAAILVVKTQLWLDDTGEMLATSRQSVWFSGAGGFGGPDAGAIAAVRMPDRPADFAIDRRTSPQAALIYRLSGDYTPFHADPDLARVVGFDRPILHGLASFGIAGHAVVSACCDGAPARLASIGCRFTNPVFPGETLRAEIWLDGPDVRFRMSAVERGIVVVDQGRAELCQSYQCGISGM